MNKIIELANKAETVHPKTEALNGPDVILSHEGLVEYTRLVVNECLGVMESCGKVLPAGSKPAMIYVRECITKHFFSEC